MIQYYTKQNGQLVSTDTLQTNSWVNISPPFDLKELEGLAEELDIYLEYLTDSLDIDERSRYEREDDSRLIIVNTPISNSNINEVNAAYYFTVPIGIILTSDYIVTITAHENPVLTKFLEDKVKGFDPVNQERFVLQLFEQNVYRFLYCLKDLNIKRNLIEQELYDSSKNRELQKLLSIEKSLVYFVTSLSSNELLKMKMLRSDVLGIRSDEEKVDLFEDIITDNSQALEMANTYTNILGGTMDAFASIISNNLNHVIKRLTMITIILMVPTLITSIFGMNVPNGAEQNPYAIWLVLIVSLVITVLVTWLATRRKWF